MSGELNRVLPRDREGYCFDSFRLDLRRGVLQRDDGTDLPLRPRSYELLLFMLDRPRELLKREALLEALWPGVAVTDDSLTQCVSELRHAFGDRGPALLRTLSRRGYILAAEISREFASTGPSSSNPTAVDSKPGRSAPGRDVLIVDVLEVASDETGAKHLAQSLCLEMLAALTQSEILSVLTRSAAPGPNSYRLSGVLLQAKEEPLLSLILDDVETSRVIWADQLTLPAPAARRGAMLALRAKIEMHVTADALHRARRKLPDDMGPHDLILLGRALHQRGGEANTQEAQQYFLRAIAMAPDLAVAHGYYALTVLRFATHGWREVDSAAQRRLALDIARRAVELEPRSALCLSALAFALLLGEQWDEAVETARLALMLSSLSAIDTRTVCAEVLAAAGEVSDGSAALQQTIALDPFCPPRSRAVLGRALLMAGRIEEAMTELHRAAAVLPDYAPCLRSIIVAAVELGRTEEALKTFARLQRIQPNWTMASRQALSFFRHQRDVDRFLAAFAICGAPAASDASHY